MDTTTLLLYVTTALLLYVTAPKRVGCLQKKHKLRDASMEDAASWAFADATFAVTFDNISNVTKLRQVRHAALHSSSICGQGSVELPLSTRIAVWSACQW